MGQRSPALTVASSKSSPIHWWGWALAALTFLGGALRFYALGDKTLWLDEAFSLWMANHDLNSMYHWLVTIDQHPPLYYLFLHNWIQWFGESPSALRSFSALTSTLAIPCYAIASRRLAGVWVALVATLLLAISPFQVRYAQEVRMYGLLMLFAAILFVALAWQLTSTEGRENGRGWSFGLLIVAEAAVMLTHNTATFLVPIALNVAIAGLLLMQRRGWIGDELQGMKRPSFYRNWILSQVGALLLWSPWACAYLRQAQGVEETFWIEPPNLWTVWVTLSTLSFAYLPSWLPQYLYLAWYAIFLVLCGSWFWRKQAALTWLMLALCLLPPAIELLISLRRPIFYDRTLIWTMLPYFILLARGIVMPNGFATHWSRLWTAVTLLLMCVLCGLGLWNYTTNLDREDWDKAAQFVAAQAAPNQLILFHASWTQLPFDYYYPENAPPLEYRGVPADLFDAGKLEPPMTEGDVAHAKELVKDQEIIWLVYSHWWYTDPQGLLLRALGEEMDVVLEQEWPGIRVIEYRQQ